MKRKLKLTILTVIILLFVLIVALIIIENNMVQLNKYDVSTSKLPSDLNLKIAHISDFHNTKSKEIKNRILKSLKEQNPDVIFITGDFIDSRRTNMEVSLRFIKKIKDIPIYYVAGNHESRIKEYLDFKEQLIKLGVNVLENESVILKNGKSTINLIGLQDPSFETGELNSTKMKEVVNDYLSDLVVNDKYNIVLLHRPELFDTIANNKVDLAFHGHAHGGQVILPFIGPILAPNQGFFPKLTSGVHTKNDTNIVISRGIGNSLCPIRINNNPELVYVTLEQKKDRN